MSKLKILIISFLVIINSSILYAHTSIVLKNDITEYQIGKHLEIFEDKTNQLTFEQIQREPYSSKFKPGNSNAPNLGFTKATIWVKFDITNNSNNSLWYLEHKYSPVDIIKIYYYDYDQNKFIIKQAGDSIDYNKKDIPYKNAVFKLNIKPDLNNIIFMQLKSSSSMNLDMSLLQPDSFFQKIDQEQMFLGIFYGIMIVMVFYNLFLYLFIRDKNYIVYCFYVISYIFFQASINGIFYKFFSGNIKIWFNNSTPLFMTLTGIFAAIFAVTFLEIKKEIPLLYKFLLVLVILNLLFLPVDILFPYKATIKKSTISIVLIIIFIFIAGTLSLLRNNKNAKYYLIAWTFFLIGGLIHSLKVFGIIPVNNLTTYSQQIGAGLEVILLSLALGNRINIIRKEKEQAQEEVIAIQKNYTASLEKTVFERTKELESERNKLHSRNQIMELEISLARKIQDNLIPEITPASFISSIYKPMEEVGGDFYDFISFPESKNIGIFLSDVSGHGVPAAFITSMIKTVLLQADEYINNPAKLLHYMNDVLQSRTAGNFVTTFYGIYNPDHRTLFYSNAGHNQPYIITDKTVSQLHGGKNTAIGMFSNNMLAMANKKFENYTEKLEEGNKLFLYTDGLVEARPVDGDVFFEDSNMEEVFLKNHSLKSGEFLDELMKELTAFAKTESFEDDICLICVDVV